MRLPCRCASLDPVAGGPRENTSAALRRLTAVCHELLAGTGGPGKQLNTSSVEPGGTRPNAALDSLREELGDDAARDFVARYLALLDCRIAGIGQSIQQRRIEPGITLLLTLETSSHMVGAFDLSLRAAALRQVLGRPRADPSAHYQGLVRAGASTRQLLAPS